MKIISVIPLKKGTAQGELTYFSSLPIDPGNIVTAPFRNKKILALCVSSTDLEAEKAEVKEMQFNLRKIQSDLGPSFFLPEFFATAQETSKYFAASLSSVLPLLIPAPFLEQYEKISKTKIRISGDKKAFWAFGKNLKSEKLLLQTSFKDRVSIYKTLIRESFARGKSIAIVLPTEHDIQKWTEELQKGIENFTYIFHSTITPAKTVKNLESLLTNDHPALILSTPPYLCIPKSGIGTIIVEHESDGAYRTIARPHLDYRTFCEIFAVKIGAKLIFGDTLLRFETIGRRNEDNLHPLYPLSFRADYEGTLRIMEKEKGKDGKWRLFGEEIGEEIEEALDKKKKIFIFSLRKGLATMTICRNCGEIKTCGKCGSPLVLYSSQKSKKRIFVCNRCEEEKDSIDVCSYCGSWNLLPLGIGTDIVYEAIKKDFPRAKVLKLDKESARTKKGAREIIKEFEEGKGGILIGTEMAFYNLNKQVPLAIVASLDSLWSIPNFRMSEKVIQILLSLEELTTEKIILNTKNPKNDALLAVKSSNILSFVRKELSDRQKLGYPPYKRFIKITFIGEKEAAIRARSTLKSIFETYNPEVYGGFLKESNKYVINALMKLDLKKWSSPLISDNSQIDENLCSRLMSLPREFEVIVDPEDLL